MAEKILKSTATTIKKGVQLALGPDLDTIKKDLAELKGEVRVLGVKQESMKNELHAEITALDSKMEQQFKTSDTKMEQGFKTVDTKLDQMDKKLDMDRRMTIMEAKMKEFEKRA